jgi:ADP-heptose:LPS heptosyltransferase
MKKFLVIQTAFIGDVVLATGVLEKLHNSFPGAEIDFLVRKGNESLFTGHPYLHEVLVWNKKQGKLANLYKMLRRIRSRRYDKVINIQRYAATGILTAFSGATETIGFDKNPLSYLFTVKVKHVFNTPTMKRHEIDRNNDLIKHFTDDKAHRPVLYPSVHDFEAVARYKTRPYICVAPASVWFTKQFPKEKWAGFLQALPFNYTVCLLGAPGDKNLCDEIARLCPGIAFINLCGELSFLQSAALMKDAHMNYVNDSAPMHFASSVNAPVTAVYCSTVPDLGYGPLSDKSFVVEIPAPLYCRPCGLHGYQACPQGHFRCAYEIRNDQLLSSLDHQ